MVDPRSRKYSGYESFQYLEPEVDYKSYELVREIGRVEPYQVPLSVLEEKRVNELYKNCMIIALHDHVIAHPANLNQLSEWSKQGRYATAYKGLSSSCIDAVLDGLMGGLAKITSKSGWHFEDIVCDIGMRLSDIAHQDFVVKCDSVKGILEAHKEGNLAFIPMMEASTPIENEVDRIDVLYGLGIRMMGITFNESNMLGSGVKEEIDGGLTHFGYRAIERMNKIGMAIDISHCGEKTSLDIIKASQKPVFISHAGAKGVWNSKRMKSDEAIKACTEKGGLIGITAAPGLTFSRKHPKMDIESVMDHFEYCVNLVGIDYVCFGLDISYGDHVGLHDVLFRVPTIGFSQVTCDLVTNEQPTKVEYVKGMENPTEGYNNTVRWLVKHGYSDGEISKIIGGNALRVLGEVWR